MGGCLLADNPGWAFTMFEINSRPPDPALVGDAWLEMWLARLEANRPWLVEWLTHQTRDAYWRHGSVCEDYAAIEIPVYAMGGWADSYSNTVPRLLAHLKSPCKGLVGPWGHQYMHHAIPGPKMSFPKEALRWLDYWLKGRPTGVMEEPGYRVWMQESIEPKTSYAHRPGR
jgi:predicted acyl esterase